MIFIDFPKKRLSVLLCQNTLQSQLSWESMLSIPFSLLHLVKAYLHKGFMLMKYGMVRNLSCMRLMMVASLNPQGQAVSTQAVKINA